MSPSTIWILIILAGLGTFLLRLSFLGLVAGEVSPLVRRALRLVPAAALTALVIPALVPPAGSPATGLADWFRLIAAVVAVLVARRTGSMFLTILAGMAVVWLLTWAT